MTPISSRDLGDESDHAEKREQLKKRIVKHVTKRVADALVDFIGKPWRKPLAKCQPLEYVSFEITIPLPEPVYHRDLGDE